MLIFVASRNNTFFEISNHLGNVHLVLSDYRSITGDGSGTITGYHSSVLSASEYYLLGMLLVEGQYYSGSYRYGFGGYEKDNEIKGTGNWYTFGDYGYDPRIVQRPTRDPKWRNYPGQSSYATFNGNPILYADPSGESGVVTIDKEAKTLTVSATVMFYGNAANTENAVSSARGIQDAWNAANGKVMIEGVEYSVQFSITGKYMPDLTPAEVDGNTDYNNNYIRVEADGFPISFMDGVGSNTGMWLLGNIADDGSTTEAHEMGHGWGLVAGTHDGRPVDRDIRGQGQPGIMYARGTIVDPVYQYNPDAAPGSPGGTLNPKKRKLLQSDIDMLGLDRLIYDSSGKANLGELTNRYHSSPTGDSDTSPVGPRKEDGSF